MRGHRRAAQDVALAGRPALGREQVALHRVVDVQEADRRVHERLQAAVEVGDEDAARAAGCGPGPCTEDGLTATTSTPAVGAAASAACSPVVLGALVDRQEGAAVRRVLAPDRAVRLAERRGGRGEHEPPHPGARRGAHGRLRPAHVDVEQRGRVVGAHRVDPRDVVDERAAAHRRRPARARPARPRAPPSRAARGERSRARVRARERDDVVAALQQPRRASAPPMKPLPPVTSTRAIVSPAG